MLLTDIADNFVESDPEAVDRLDRIFDHEDKMIVSGKLGMIFRSSSPGNQYRWQPPRASGSFFRGDKINYELIFSRLPPW